MKLPWQMVLDKDLDMDDDLGLYVILDSEGKLVADLLSEASAKFILEKVNHD